MSKAIVSSTTLSGTTISPETRFLLSEFCRLQREKYGPDWKRIFFAEQAANCRPEFLEALAAFDTTLPTEVEHISDAFSEMSDDFSDHFAREAT